MGIGRDLALALGGLETISAVFPIKNSDDFQIVLYHKFVNFHTNFKISPSFCNIFTIFCLCKFMLKSI